MKLLLILSISLCALAGPALSWGTSPEDRVRQIASALVMVETSCPTLIANRRAASMAIEANGYSMKEISQGPAKDVIVRSYLALKAEPERACYAIYDTFGPEGTGVRGIVSRKAR